MRFAFSAFMVAALAACSSETVDPAAQEYLDAQRNLSKPPPERDCPPPAGLERYRLSGPYTSGNLSVFLIHDADASQDDLGCITLEEALRSGAIKVTEKAEGAEVNQLEVENTGDKPVYLQAGDTVKGGQQDRTIGVDFILPPHSGRKPVDAFCVEPGRWRARTTPQAEALEFPSGFAESKASLATKEQKLAVRLNKSQEKVWAAGAVVNEKLVRPQGSGGPLTGATFSLGETKSSYVLATENSNVVKGVAERMARLEKAPADRKDVVGAAFCVNGAFQFADLYLTAGLFRNLWPKLLRSAAIDALARDAEGEAASVPAPKDVQALIDELRGHAGRVEIRPGAEPIRIYERERIVLFDTESSGRLLHRQIIAK